LEATVGLLRTSRNVLPVTSVFHRRENMASMMI
jgi:hypothetical protein